MKGMNLWLDNADMVMYVDDCRMLEYNKRERTVRIIGALDGINRIEREYGIEFLKPGESPPEPEPEKNKTNWLKSLFFK